MVFPEYFDPIQEYGDEQCISTLQEAVKAIDLVLDLPGPAARIMKGMFGLEELADDDFAEVLQSPIGEIVMEVAHHRLLASTELGPRRQHHRLDGLLLGPDIWPCWKHHRSGQNVGGAIATAHDSPASVVNYARYIKENVVSRCPTDVVDVSKLHAPLTVVLWLVQR